VRKDAKDGIYSGHRFMIFLDENQVPYVLDASRPKQLPQSYRIKPRPLSTYLQEAGYKEDDDMKFYISTRSYQPA
jgi:hypothetical protein